MMLAIEPIRPGRVYFWAISQITTRESTDRGFYTSWEDMLEKKRRDGHYPDVVHSIQTWGFLRPLNADVAAGRLQLSDGHHRLAASIDLGFEAVPVYVEEHPIISDDSGYWKVGDPVDLDPATCGEPYGSW